MGGQHQNLPNNMYVLYMYYYDKMSFRCGKGLKLPSSTDLYKLAVSKGSVSRKDYLSTRFFEKGTKSCYWF